MIRSAAVCVAVTALAAAQGPSDFEPLYRKALTLREAKLGPAHPKTAESRLNLALYLAEQGRMEDAEPLIERAYRDLQGADAGPQARADALDAWASLRLGQGDRRRAKELLKTAAGLREAGTERWAETLSRLADLERIEGDLEAAESLYRRALQAGPDAGRLRRLAVTLEEHGAAREAEAVYLKALESGRREEGELHPDIALTLNSLGLLAAGRQDWDAAAARLSEAVEIYRRTLGPDSLEAAAALDNLGNVRRARGELEAAQSLLERALAIRLAKLGESHPETASTLNNLAGLFHVQGRLDKAEPLYRRSLQAREDDTDPAAGETLYNLGHLLRQRGDPAAAAEAFRQSLRVLESAYGPADPFVAEVRDALASVESRGTSGSAP